MTEFKELGGVSTMDPPAYKRWIASQMLKSYVSVRGTEKRRVKAERKRLKENAPHRVEYFHFIDDPYSHLTAQVLINFTTRYRIELDCHLVSEPPGDNAPELDMLMDLSLQDAHHIARYYGLTFAQRTEPPRKQLFRSAEAILAAQDNADFIAVVANVGEALWSDDHTALQLLATQYGSLKANDVAEKVEAGNARRDKLKHYSGAMFYYAGEWYWGIDRLYHLEMRLADLHADTLPGQPLIAARPETPFGPLHDTGSLTLEFFPTLRSPYSAIVFDRTVALAKATGVKLALRPVLPMVMRGIPTTPIKGPYIFWDTGREAEAAGVPFGNIYDPIGEPVRRCCSLLPWAEENGKATELMSAFYACAFVNGINTNSMKGLQKVVEQAGLDWSEAKRRLGDPEGARRLEDNRLCLYRVGIWGTPSFRLLDQDGVQLLALWGQDRLWRIGEEIQIQLKNNTKPATLR